MNVILLNFLGGYKFNDGKYNKFFGFFYWGKFILLCRYFGNVFEVKLVILGKYYEFFWGEFKFFWVNFLWLWVLY